MRWLHELGRDLQKVAITGMEFGPRLYKAARKSGRIASATHIPRLTALGREQPDRVPLEVKRIANELVNKTMPETVRLLNERWSEVEAVASLLLKHTVVTPELCSSPTRLAGICGRRFVQSRGLLHC